MDLLQQIGFSMSFSRDQQSCFATKNKIKLRFSKDDGLYKLRAKKKMLVTFATLSTALPKVVEEANDAATLWHQRFAHASTGTLVKMSVQGAVAGLNPFANDRTYSVRSMGVSKLVIQPPHGTGIFCTFSKTRYTPHTKT